MVLKWRRVSSNRVLQSMLKVGRQRGVVSLAKKGSCFSHRSSSVGYDTIVSSVECHKGKLIERRIEAALLDSIKKVLRSHPVTVNLRRLVCYGIITSSCRVLPLFSLLRLDSASPSVSLRLSPNGSNSSVP
jgi:hypothetical protein